MKKPRLVIASVMSFFALTLPALAQDALQNIYKRLEPFERVDIYNQPGLIQGGNARHELIIRVAKVVNVFLSLFVITMVILILYGGYLWMPARGNEKQVDDAKHTIKSAVIGAVIILMAAAITMFVIRGVLRATTE